MLYGKEISPGNVQWPYTFKELKADNPSVSFPNMGMSHFVGSYGVVEIAETPEPAYDPDAEQAEITGVTPTAPYATVWTVSPLPPEVIAEIQKKAAHKLVMEQAKADAFIQQFVQYDAQQVQNYIDNNMGNLNEARAIVKKLALICLALAKTRLS